MLLTPQVFLTPQVLLMPAGWSTQGQARPSPPLTPESEPAAPLLRTRAVRHGAGVATSGNTSGTCAVVAHLRHDCASRRLIGDEAAPFWCTCASFDRLPPSSTSLKNLVAPRLCSCAVQTRRNCTDMAQLAETWRRPAAHRRNLAAPTAHRRNLATPHRSPLATASPLIFSPPSAATRYACSP